MRKIKKINSSSFLSKIIDTVIGKGAYTLFMFLFTVICARLFGAETFGEYTYLFTLVTIFSYLITLGLDNGLVYSLPKDGKKYVSFAFLLNVISFLLISCLFIIFVDNRNFLKMLPIIGLFSLELMFFAIYKFTGNFRGYYLVNGILSMILRIIIVILLWFMYEDSINSIILGVTISLLIANLFYLYKSKIFFGPIYVNKELLKFSIPLIMANMTTIFLGKVGILMLGSMATNKDVAIYQIITQIAGFIGLLLIIFSSVFAPQIAKFFHEKEMQKVKYLYIKSTRILFGIGLAFAVIVILFSDEILWIFGDEFVDGKIALIYLVGGQFVNVAVGGVWTLLAMTGKPKLQMYANIFSLFLNIVLNAILIPYYGFLGAAISSMICISITNIIGYLIVSRTFNLKVFKFI